MSSAEAPAAAVRTIQPTLERQRAADLAQPAPFVVEELATHAQALAVWDVDHEPSGQRQLHRQATALGPHRILGRLNEHLVALLEQVRDLALVLGHANGDYLVDMQEPALGQPDVDE